MSIAMIPDHGVSSRLERLTLMSRLAEHCSMSEADVLVHKNELRAKYDPLRKVNLVCKFAVVVSLLCCVVAICMHMQTFAQVMLMLFFGALFCGLSVSVHVKVCEDKRICNLDECFRLLSSAELQGLFQSIEERNDPTLSVLVANLFTQNYLLRVSDQILIESILRLDDEQIAKHSIELFLSGHKT
jgi:hypothetical protein